jgi:hypothetical protein
MNVILLLILVITFLTVSPFAAITINDFKNELITLYKGVEK